MTYSHRVNSAMRSKRAQTFRFLSLPPEIRDSIYNFCISGSHYGNIEDNGQHIFDGCLNPLLRRLRVKMSRDTDTCACSHVSPPFPPQLLQICRQIRLEAAPVVDNHFLAIGSIQQAYYFLLSIGHARRAQLRKLSFAWRMSCHHLPRVRGLLDDIGGRLVVKRCCILISRECRELRILTIRFFGFGSAINPRWPEHETPPRALWGVGHGWLAPALLSIKGLESVDLLALKGTHAFDDETEGALEEYRKDMTGGKRRRKKADGQEGQRKSTRLLMLERDR